MRLLLLDHSPEQGISPMIIEMKIALIPWKEEKVSSQDRDEISLLRKYFSEKHEVINITDEEDTSSDIDAALMRIPDYINNSKSERLAWRLWDRGVPFLVDPLWRRLARNKLYAQKIFAEEGIKQPRWSLDPSDLSGEIIQKPLCGGKSIDVTWHESPPQAKPNELFLFQEYRKPDALWRTIASPEGIVLSYKKVSEEKIISVSSGAKREIVTPSPELQEISQAMASALGGGLWGLDVIEDREGFWALEANMNFGYPAEYAEKITAEIIRILEKKCT